MAYYSLIVIIVLLMAIVVRLYFKQKNIDKMVEKIDNLSKEPFSGDHNSQWFEGFKAGVKWGFKAGTDWGNK